jgi:predicted O-linked N-acetylglucosamine transferase (SPINDLY family)
MTIEQVIATGLEHHRAGRLEEAETIYRQALTRQPNHHDALQLLGTLAYQRGAHTLAAECLTRAIAANPNVAHYHNNLGSALIELDRSAAAIAAYQRALALNPAFQDAHRNLADALADAGRFDEAIVQYTHAMQLQPNWPEMLNNFGHALQAVGRHAEAAERFSEALALDPSFAAAHANLAGVLLESGDIDAALRSHRAAVQLRPDMPALGSNLLYAMHFDAEIDDDSLFRAHVDWSEKHAARSAAAPLPRDADHADNRILRIGYVSQDLRDHPVGRFLFPVLANHDRGQFEVHLFDGTQLQDDFTDQLKSCFWQWHTTRNLTDERLAELIRAQSIDILVDLAGHTGGNRLLAFARKPAPVQATYLGYPDTTGLTSIDCRITDALADPPGRSDTLNTERLIRLPRGFFCYQPPAELPPICRGDRPITFGSFNNLAKLSPPTLQLWRRILDGAPGARLLIKSQAMNDAMRDRLAAAGLPMERVDLRSGSLSHAEHLRGYNDIDVALDTTPYNGATTTCEALAMGVPVVTLAGTRHAARVGVSILTNAGFADWIANSPDEYVQIAAALAASPTARSDVRERFLASPMCDAAPFTRDLEAAYREMWCSFIGRSV